MEEEGEEIIKCESQSGISDPKINKQSLVKLFLCS
jgi:hypothetical protein